MKKAKQEIFSIDVSIQSKVREMLSGLLEMMRIILEATVYLQLCQIQCHQYEDLTGVSQIHF